MSDTVSISIAGSKQAQGDIDRSALSDAIAPHLAGVRQAFLDLGCAPCDIDITTSINDETIGALKGDDAVFGDPEGDPESGES